MDRYNVTDRQKDNIRHFQKGEICFSSRNAINHRMPIIIS